MENRNLLPPIIIIGTHRSGTSIVSKMLEICGLFLGHQKDPNNEAKFFLALNDWMLWQCGASWDNPVPTMDLIENKAIRALAVDYIQYMFKSPWYISYLGFSRYCRYKTGKNLNMTWGWKDPRNTFLLPIWLDIFPDAKIIHVYRNGVDVARSLKTRSEISLKRKLLIYKRLRYLYWPINRKRRFFSDSLRCLDMDKGIELWDLYMKKARFFLSNLKNDVIEIKYEKMISKPDEMLQNLSEFCGLKCEKRKIMEAVSMIKPRRPIASHEQEALKKIANRYASLLKAHGY